MIRRRYSILMRTQLGDRKGTMEIHIEKDKARGYLDILEHREPFEGCIDEKGYCCFRGNLVTLMSIIPYTATGQIAPDFLRLSMDGGRNRFHITGIPYGQNEAEV